MDIDWAWLIPQIALWGITILGALLIVGFVVGVLDDRSDFPTWHERQKFWSSSVMFGLLQFSALIWLIGWGVNSFVWFMPEYVPDDYEGATRSGVALTIGLIGAAFVIQIVSKLRDYRRDIAGKNEILSEIALRAERLMAGDAAASAAISALLEKTAEQKRTYLHPIEEIAMERKIKFYEDLKRAIEFKAERINRET